MKEFVFAEYVKEIKKAIKGRRASEKVISDLYGLVAIPAQLEDKNGDIIACAKSTAFNIMHRKTNAHLEIQAHSQDTIVINNIGKRYQTRFENLFHDAKLPHCLDAIHEAVEDSDLHRDRKLLLLSKYSKESPWDFLGLVFLEIVVFDNKLIKGTEPSHPNETSNETGLTHSFPNRPMVERSDDINSEEAVYVAALLEAYGEAESREGFCIDDLPSYPTRQRDFNSQRESYYAAEEVRRGTRDIYSADETDQFEVFKEEIFRGVEMVFYDDHDNGMVRLRKVLSQAAQTSIQKCWLANDTDWLGTMEKRGACHFLVNDGTLPGWVNVNE